MTNRASLGLMTYDIQYNDLLQSPWTSFPYRSYCAVKGKPSSWMFLEFRCATMCHVVQRGFTPHNFCTYQPCAWVAKETNLGRIPNRSSILYYIYIIYVVVPAIQRTDWSTLAGTFRAHKTDATLEIWYRVWSTPVISEHITIVYHSYGEYIRTLRG